VPPARLYDNLNYAHQSLEMGSRPRKPCQPKKLKNLAQPAQRQKEAGRGAEGGEEEDEEDAGDAVAPPATHSDDIVADVFEVTHGRWHDPSLGEAGKEADTEGGVEGGDRGGDKGGENC